MEQDDLANVAKQAKDELNTTDSNSNDTSTEINQSSTPADKSRAAKKPAIIGLSQSADKVSNMSNDEMLKSGAEDKFTLTDDDLKAGMPDVDPETFKTSSINIRREIENYRKGLVLHGYTIEEAETAARNRVLKLTKDANDTYLTNNPKLGIVEIDKKDVDKIEFTAEEQAKLQKVKAIKLVIVEDQELKTLSVEKIDRKHKSSAIQMADGVLSKYGLPIPIAADFLQFKGAQIIQLISAMKYDDDGLDGLISKKASLIYDRLIGGTHFKKYDELGKTVMSYNDFVNRFPFHDIDLGLYGIFVASSAEESETSLTCGNCQEPFQWKYNIKALLKLDDISDYYKGIIDDILGNKLDEQFLQSLFDKINKPIRVKSPVTNNIYDIAYPCIARAINIYKTINQHDETLIYLSAIALFTNSIYIYNQSSGNYIYIEEDEYKETMEALQIIPQADIDLLLKFIQDRLYIFKFILDSKCPHCGHTMSNELRIDDMVFLLAHGSPTEIRI
jgi:hypothetical protein